MSFGITDITLTTALANAGTVDFPYPIGLAQGNYTNGLAGTGHVLIVNNADIYTTGFTLSFGASTITLTNSSMGTIPAGSTLKLQADRAGDDGFRSAPILDNDVIHVTFPVTLASVGAGDYVNGFRPGFAGNLEHLQYLPAVAGTGASATITFTPKINSTPGVGTLVVALADTAIATAAKQASALSGVSFGPTDTVSLTASAITAFSAGSGSIIARFRRRRTQAG